MPYEYIDRSKPESELLTVELECVVCGEKWMGKEPRMCCNGYQCGCMGMPIEPEVCSEECYDKLIASYSNPRPPQPIIIP